MPSLRHEVLARGVPALRKSRELDTPEAERARLERWHATLDRSFPTRVVPGFGRRFTHRVEHVGDAVRFPVHAVARRGRAARRTVVYLHGGGYVAPIDPFHVRYAARLATALDARVLLPDYPLAPEHTWRDSHDTLVDLVAEARPVLLAGDSAGGGLALAVAQSLRDRGLPQPQRLLLHAPWVDLTASTPATAWFAARDPWLFPGKLRAYAAWWAGSEQDLARPEVSPALGDLAGLPPALAFAGTRDLLLPGCRLLARRAAEAGWDLTYVERDGLIHVYPLLPGVPEAAEAWRQTRDFLGVAG